MTYPTDKTTRPGCNRNGSETKTEETIPMSVLESTALTAPSATEVLDRAHLVPGCTEDHARHDAIAPDSPQECSVYGPQVTIPLSDIFGGWLDVQSYASAFGTERNADVVLSSVRTDTEGNIELSSHAARVLAAQLIKAADESETAAFGQAATETPALGMIACPSWCTERFGHPFETTDDPNVFVSTHRHVIFEEPSGGVFEQQDVMAGGRVTREPVTFSLRGVVVAVGEAEMRPFIERFAKLCADIDEADAR